MSRNFNESGIHSFINISYYSNIYVSVNTILLGFDIALSYYNLEYLL